MSKEDENNSSMIIGFHNAEGTGKELISGAYQIARILKTKYPELKLIRIPNLYNEYKKMNPKSKKIFEKIKDTKNAAMISGAISGDNTYHIRARYKFNYKIVEIKPIPSLQDVALLKKEKRDKIDWLIIRHNRGIFTLPHERWIKKPLYAEWTTKYSFNELEKLAEISFEYAMKRKRRLTLMVKSKDKSHVITLWKSAFLKAAEKFPEVKFDIMNPDLATVEDFIHPTDYDVLFMPDIIGDTLSDMYATLINGNRNTTGSANFNVNGFAYYNTLHGAAFDLIGKNKINPIGTIENLALIFKYSLNREDIYNLINKSINEVVKIYRTEDILSKTTKEVSTSKMFNLIGNEIKRQLK